MNLFMMGWMNLDKKNHPSLLTPLYVYMPKKKV